MKILWLYEGDHVNHPFIRLAANSLAEAGNEVLVIDNATQVLTAKYTHRLIVSKLSRSRQETKDTDQGRVTKKESMIQRTAGLRVLRHVRMFASRTRLWGFIFARILKFRPKVIISSLPPGFLTAAAASKLTGSKLVYYPFELFGEQVQSVPDRWLKIERWLLRHVVDTLVTQNDKRAELYLHERDSRVQPVIIGNYKASKTVRRQNKLRELLDIPAGKRLVLYEGLLTNGRWLDKLVVSVKYLPDDVCLGFIGSKRRWWVEAVEPLLADADIGNKVIVGPLIPHDDLLSYVADADAGVIIYDDLVRNNYYCAPGKLSDYVLAGVPIIAPDFPTIGPVIERWNIGVTFPGSEPQEIAKAILEVLDTPRHKWDTSLDIARKELVWETQVPTLLQSVTGS
jgi:glycosyltransferase involved in cell wall biosynthesis